MAVWQHTITEGQSLAIGSQGTPSLSTVSEVGNAWLVDPTDGTATIPLKNATQQRPDLSMGYRIGGHRPGLQHGFSTHGLGGQSISALSKGGSSGKYEAALACVQAAHDVRVAAGDTYTVEALHWIQGEADQTFGTSPDAYIAALVKLRADHLADIGAITGQTTLPVIGSQTATWAHYANPPSIGLAQLAVARTQPGQYIVGGQYQLPYYTDGLHLTNVGYYRLGELHARAHEAIVAGAGWAPFAPTSTVLAADHLDVVFHVPTGALEFDTTTVPAQANMGFSLSGTAAAVTSVTLTAADTVRLGLSQQIVEPGARVGYGVTANNGSVGLGNLCDGETATSVCDATRLANWALHFDDDLGVVRTGPTTVFALQDLYFTRSDKRLQRVDVTGN